MKRAKCVKCQKKKQINKFASYWFKKRGRYICKECKNQYERSRYFLPKTRYSYCKKHAKERKIEFTITLDEFDDITKKECVYCGKFSYNEIKITGIDRVDSNLGYILNNCVSCCYKCNTMKNAMTQAEFFQHINDIIKFRKSKNGQITNI